MDVAYQCFHDILEYDRFSGASQMFVQNRDDNFGTHMRRLMYGFRERLPASVICLVVCLMKRMAWSNSELCKK